MTKCLAQGHAVPRASHSIPSLTLYQQRHCSPQVTSSRLEIMVNLGVMPKKCAVVLVSVLVQIGFQRMFTMSIDYCMGSTFYLLMTTFVPC